MSKRSPRRASSGTTSAAFPSNATESPCRSRAAPRTRASAWSRESVASSRYRVSRRRRGGSQNAGRLAALAGKGLVLCEPEERAYDCAQGLVAPRRLARAAVDDEVLGSFGNLGVEVVQEHAQGCLRLPRARVEPRPARRPDT